MENIKKREQTRIEKEAKALKRNLEKRKKQEQALKVAKEKNKTGSN